MKREVFVKALLITPLALISKSCFRSPQSGVENSGSQNTSKRVFLTGISSNHGHLEIDLKPENIETGATGSFLLSGGNHIHPFTLNQFQLSTLKQGKQISITVFGNYHSHGLTIYYGEQLPSNEGDS